MRPTPRQFLTAYTHLHQAATDAVVEFHINADVPEKNRGTAHSSACMRNLVRAAEALGFKLVPATAPAMAHEKEVDHEVINFPVSALKPGAPSTGAGRFRGEDE